MTADSQTGLFPPALSMADIEAVRLILRGESAIDWHKLHLKNQEEVNRFLKVNGFDANNPQDLARLDHVLARSIDYLRKVLNYHFPQELCVPGVVPELLLIASSDSKLQALACILLKVMHIVQHVEAQELRHRLTVSEDELFTRALDSVQSVMDEMIQGGAPIADFKASRKSHESLITKLLSKRSTQAAQIFDRVRFRIVTKNQVDLIPVLAILKDKLLPYNYIIPGQSRNEILPVESFLELPLSHPYNRSRLHLKMTMEEAFDERDWNRFSATGFRMVNFVIDMPVDVRDLVSKSNDPALKSLGNIVFLIVEVQMFDLATWKMNEQGEGSHNRYKDRQHWEVVRRLEHGGRIGGIGGPRFAGKTRF
jgi:uncharacterized protein (TIGR04552 family)